MNVRALVVSIVLVACGGSPTSPTATTKVVAFAHVTVVPMTSERELPDQNVIVEGARIVAVGPAASTPIPRGATVIDGRGAWLVPGLVDMHTHGVDADDRVRYLANGVTSIRVTWGFPDIQGLQNRIANGTAIGPWIYSTGPLMDGEPPVWNGSIVLRTPDDAVRAADEQKQQGYEMIKVYGRLPADVYAALAKRAKENGQRLVGHVPEAVGLEGVLAARQASIEHLEGYGRFIARDRAAAAKMVWQPEVDLLLWLELFADADPARVAEAVRLTKQAGTWNVPTLVLFDRYANLDIDESRKLPGVDTLSLASIEGWKPANNRFAKKLSKADFDRLRAALPFAPKLVAELHRGGARILAGTDVPNPFVVAGYAMHDELARLHAAGLSNFETLVAATTGPAEFLRADFGTIEPGKRADLILVEGDPLADLGALSRRRGTMARGRWFPQPELDRQIADITAINRGLRSRFAGVPLPPVDGTRVFVARYVHRRGEATSFEERVVIDRATTGTLVVTSEARGGGDQTVKVGLDGKLLVLADDNGRLELVRDGGIVHVSYTPAGGTAVKQDAPLDPSLLLSGPTVAPDHLFYAVLATLAPGAKGTWKLAAPGAKDFVLATLEATRKPDEQKLVANKMTTVRRFDFVLGEDPGTIWLDADGHLAEQELGGERIIRVE